MLQSWSCAEQLPISASCAAQQSPKVLNPLPSSPQWRQCAFHLVKKPSFEYGILAAIVVNVLFNLPIGVV